MNKEILERIEIIQEVYPNTVMNTIYQAVCAHLYDYTDDKFTEISDEELLACLKAEIHTIMNG